MNPEQLDSMIALNGKRTRQELKLNETLCVYDTR